MKKNQSKKEEKALMDAIDMLESENERLRSVLEKAEIVLNPETDTYWTGKIRRKNHYDNMIPLTARVLLHDIQKALGRFDTPEERLLKTIFGAKEIEGKYK